MEILIAVVVVLAIAAFLGRGQSSAPARHLAAQPPVSPAPGLVGPTRETPDDAFVLGYVIGRHVEDRHHADVADRYVEDSCDEIDGVLCNDAYDDGDE